MNKTTYLFEKLIDNFNFKLDFNFDINNSFAKYINNPLLLDETILNKLIKINTLDSNLHYIIYNLIKYPKYDFFSDKIQNIVKIISYKPKSFYFGLLNCYIHVQCSSYSNFNTNYEYSEKLIKYLMEKIDYKNTWNALNWDEIFNSVNNSWNYVNIQKVIQILFLSGFRLEKFKHLLNKVQLPYLKNIINIRLFLKKCIQKNKITIIYNIKIITNTIYFN